VASKVADAEGAGRRRAGPPGRAGPPAPGWVRLVVVAVAVAFVAPLAYLVARNAGAAGRAELAAAVTDPGTLGPLGRSLWLALTVSAATAVLGTALAWLVERTDLPGRRALRVLLPLPLVVPSFIAAFALIAAFAPGGLLAGPLGALGVRPPRIRGFWGAFSVLTLFTYPYVYLPVAARLRQLPASLEESARLLGRGPAVTFLRVVLPQAAAAVAAGALLVGLYTLSDFGAVQLLRYDTQTRAIYSARVLDPAGSLALALLLGVLAVAVAAAERRVAPGRGRPASAAGHGRSLTVPLRAWRWPALAGVGTVLALSLLAPLGVLGWWALRGLLAGSGRAGAVVADPAELIGPALGTAWVSVAAAVVAVVAVLPVAWLTVRRRSRLGEAAGALVVGGFALPGLVLALALAFWARQAPEPVFRAVYQTPGLLVFAYVVHFGAQALRAAQVAVGSVPRQVEDAARVLGARGPRRLLTVELPLAMPGLAAGGGLVLLSSAKELPATLLLAPPGFQTLATKVWTASEDAFLADASLGALALVAVSALLTWLLVVRRGRGLA
jgi:iron(III) transport system permease protein